MRVLVCGGRDFDDFSFVHKYLEDRLLEYYVHTPEGLGHWSWDLVIIQGGAKGADRLADKWAQLNYVKVEEYPADWERYGKKAGYLRNKQMLEEGKPDLVIAFPGGRGTDMMIRLAKDAGVPVEIVQYNEE